ncbi:hypothetical protein NPIL_4541 [Nephila pilipes]|uniref:Uncharacterized protein n=1 Tax=Nephila pilipes TaxID=299642 RepID=A0A8X6MJF3_NEPPI|nr:hypothetical protein NPIL_4541 [Nephila pilipes]
MNSLVITFLLLPLVGAQSVPRWLIPYYSDIDNEYAASLGDAPIGLYNRRRESGSFGETSEVSGVSINNAKVGLYGRERGRPSYSKWPLL